MSLWTWIKRLFCVKRLTFDVKFCDVNAAFVAGVTNVTLSTAQSIQLSVRSLRHIKAVIWHTTAPNVIKLYPQANNTVLVVPTGIPGHGIICVFVETRRRLFTAKFFISTKTNSRAEKLLIVPGTATLK